MVDILAPETNIDHMNDENMDIQEANEGGETDEKPKEEAEAPMEEGELPEEGEITDEDEPPAAPAVAPQHPRGHRPPKSRSKTGYSHPPTRHTKPPPKYKDVESKTITPASRNTMMESWINGVQKKNKHSPTGPDSNEEYYRVGDAHDSHPLANDSYQPVDEFGDVDYRPPIDEAVLARPEQRVHRRSGSPVDDYGTIPKRCRMAPAPYEESVGLAARRVPSAAPARWTQATICKFFREGYCRDGNQCVFSHNASDSKRRPELCRFYERGYCKRGLSCANLHGEFPCKAFHKGDCPNEPCRFSHLPLDDYTRPLFEQMLRDEEVAQRVASMAGTRPKRRVLLPNGPEPWDNYPLEGRRSMDYSRSHHQSSFYPPSAPVRCVGGPIVSFGGFFNAHPMSRPGNARASGHSPVHQRPFSPHGLSNVPARRLGPPAEETFDISDALGKFIHPSSTGESQLSSAPTGSVSPSLISDSLQSLQHMFDSVAHPIVDESPASPPASGVVASDSAPLIPISRSFVAYPLAIPPSTSLDLNLIQQITSGRYKNDPRLKRIAEKQFDLVSKTLEQENGIVISDKNPSAAQPAPPRQDPRIPSAAQAPMAAPNLPKPVDPRSRDPRIVGASTIAAHPPAHVPNTPHYSIPPTTSAQSLSGPAHNEMDFQSMVEQQIQMANEMAAQQQAAALHRREDFDMRGPPVGDSRFESRPPPDVLGHRIEATSPSYSSRGRGGGVRRGRELRNANFAPLGRAGRFEDNGGAPHSRWPRMEDRWGHDADGRHHSNSTSPRDLTADHPPAEASHAALTLREKRKDNEYESPLRARTGRF